MICMSVSPECNVVLLSVLLYLYLLSYHGVFRLFLSSMILHGCPPGSIRFTFEDEWQCSDHRHGQNLSYGLGEVFFLPVKSSKFWLKASIIFRSTLFSLLGLEIILLNDKFHINLNIVHFRKQLKLPYTVAAQNTPKCKIILQ